MTAEVYYFSGTGNSLYTAGEIARRINGKLISIPQVMADAHMEPEAEVVGIVFPVYYATNDCGIPLIIARFVRQLQNLNSKYVFAVCTCGSMPGTTIENLGKLVKFQGGELAAGFTLKMSNRKISPKKQEKVSADHKEKLNAICEYIIGRKKGKMETRGILRKTVLAPLLYLAIKPAFNRRYRKLSGSPHLPFKELIPIADRSFQVGEKCSGCGICAQVCPADNIKIIDRRPEWQHHCETCYACYAWCPQGAIGGEIVEYNPRYHNPNIKLSDMLKTKH
jgi:ferredoxin